jgi:ribosomal protein L22
MKNKGYTFEITEDMASAKTTDRVSTKHSQFVARHLNGLNLLKAKELLEGLISQKIGIDSYMGKYYTKSSEGLLRLLKLLEANALNRGLDFETMNVFVSAHRGPAYRRSRRKQKFGTRLKVSHLHAVLKPGKNTKPAVKKDNKKVLVKNKSGKTKPVEVEKEKISKEKKQDNGKAKHVEKKSEVKKDVAPLVADDKKE